LEAFDYSGVRLLDGLLKKQYLATRDFYLAIPDDSILLGFRRRAGQPAPGKELPGWYGMDVFNAFGQWLSGMARMSKATGDGPMRDKATRLLREWAKTVEADGYFYYSRQPTTPHYIYEKSVCGLVDMYQYADQRERPFRFWRRSPIGRAGTLTGAGRILRHRTPRRTEQSGTP
jgi:hypothetical protein